MESQKTLNTDGTVEERRLVKNLLSQRPHRDSWLMILAVLAVVAATSQFYWADLMGWSQMMSASRGAVYGQGEWWRLFTATLIHSDFGHLASNAFTLTIFGYFIYGYFGSWAFPGLTFVLAAVVNGLAIMTYPLKTQLLGASGWVYILGGFWLTMYFFIQRQYKWYGRVLRVIGIGLVLFFPTTFVPSTSYRTHAIGFLAGIVLAMSYFWVKRQEIYSQEIYRYPESENRENPMVRDTVH